MAFIAHPLPSVAPTSTKSSSQTLKCSLPPRVVLDPLPNLFVYDHCPFCVRVRHALGLKNVKHNLVWLMNDDAATPTSLIGKKMVPIFQPEGSSGPSVGESLDIIKLIDSDEKYGRPSLFKPEENMERISSVIGEMSKSLSRLTRTRYALSPFPEFAFEDSRETYIRNHPLQDPESYEENLNRSEEYIAVVQSKMDALNDLIYSKEHCSPSGLSYDDIVLFPRLRSFTIIKGLEIPQKMREYVDYQAQIAEIPLYDCYKI